MSRTEVKGLRWSQKLKVSSNSSKNENVKVRVKTLKCFRANYIMHNP